MTRACCNLIRILLFSIVYNAKIFAQLPAGLAAGILQNGYTAPMGVVFSNAGSSMWTWEKAGKVYISKWDGTTYKKQTTPVLDISDEVGNWSDFGLLSICLDPDFESNNLIYLYYVVDRHHLLYAGTSQYNAATNDYFKATIGRVTRYRLSQGASVGTDYSTRKILIGESITTGIPCLHDSHMGGSLVFGSDKTLLLTTGDGSSYNVTDVGSSSDTYYQQALTDGIIRSAENVGAFRAQMVNSLNGKLLRFDPNTGDGIASNPFYDAANPRSPKSRVWAMGFRNPFRMSVQPNTGTTNVADGNPGTFLIGDVGWNTWEEINVISVAGLNAGWPLFEGQTTNSSYAAAATVNQDEGQQFKTLCIQPTSFTFNTVISNRRLTHYRPALAWKHGVNDTRVPSFNGMTPTDPQVGASGSPTAGQPFAGNCAIGGIYYTGTALGAAYQNKYFFGDYGTNLIKVTDLNASQPWFTTVLNFAPANFTNAIVDIQQNPLDNSILYVNINSGEIMRIAATGTQPPVAAIAADKTFGASPLTINFSSAGSNDPDGGSLQYLWDFGDGTTSTAANPSHTYTGSGISSFTATLTVTDPTTMTASKSVIISLNNTPPKATITTPVNNSTYSILTATSYTLNATVTDNETTAGMLYSWQQVLRHNNHEHREPVLTTANPSVVVSPVGCDGETYYYLFLLTVTDNGKLTASDSVKIYPDCSTAGLAVTGLAATAQNSNAVLTWTNPTAAFDEIMIAARPGSGFLTNPSGTGYVADPSYTGAGTAFEGGKIVYKGTDQAATITNLSPGTTYYFRVFTRSGNTWTGGVETSVTIGTNLAGSVVADATTVNLTTEGTADWAHWYGYDHKATGGGKISNYSLIGTGTVLNYTDDPRTCTWSDGTPTASGSNKNGIYITGIGKGFQITAPADLTQRTLKVYVGGWQSGGTLTASLSDASSPDYVNTSISSATGQYAAVYTLIYKAGSAGKLLTVKWVQASGTGNVTLEAATLVQQGGTTTVNVTGVTLNPTSASIVTGGTQQLTATIAPSNATNQAVTWSSSNTAIATVSATGLVTAVAAGTATITVTTQDGAKTATATITVTQSTPVTGSLTGTGVASSATVNLTTEGTADWAHWYGYDHKAAGGSKISNYSIVGTGTVTNYTNDPRTCTWTDGTPTATGSNKNGIYITGIGKGFQVTAPADLTQRTLKVYVGGWQSGGTLTASLSDASAPDYSNTSISSSTGQYNAVYTLTYKAGSAGKLLTVKWVQASGTGNVTLGAATLVESGGTTIVNVTGITLSPASASIAAGSTQQLTATVAPANATNQTVTWSSSNTAIATVSTTGLVTGIAAGTATITVTTQDGAKTATASITVTQSTPVTGSLTGTGVASSATVNLTTEGTGDWAHWYGYDHKAAGGSKISNYSLVGTGTVSNYTNDPRTCTWTDGTPTTSGSNKNGIYITGIGKGFQITAPADLTQRTLKVYVGGWRSGGTLTATLSDGSAASYSNSSYSSSTGQYNAVYTLTYKAAAAGKLLTVKWVQASGTGNVTLQAATVKNNAARQVNAGQSQDSAGSGTALTKSLEIYPNPFADNFILSYSGNETGPGKISVYTYDMRLVSVYRFEKATWNLTQHINPKGLSNGLYIVEMQIGDTKIIKQLLRFR
ncbi:MAG: Ig-like domain-containing protein [Chitinophagaceae bacterium]